MLNEYYHGNPEFFTLQWRCNASFLVYLVPHPLSPHPSLWPEQTNSSPLCFLRWRSMSPTRLIIFLHLEHWYATGLYWIGWVSAGNFDAPVGVRLQMTHLWSLDSWFLEGVLGLLDEVCV